MTPQLVDAYKNKGDNVEYILMNYDDNQKAMDKYLVKSKINFPGLKNAERDKSFLTKIFPTEALPTLVIADSNGKVISSGVGAEVANVLAKAKKLK